MSAREAVLALITGKQAGWERKVLEKVTELETMLELTKVQALTHKEDFERERKDREDASSKREEDRVIHESAVTHFQLQVDGYVVEMSKLVEENRKLRMQCKKGQSELKKLANDKNRLEAALQCEKEMVSQLTEKVAQPPTHPTAPQAHSRQYPPNTRLTQHFPSSPQFDQRQPGHHPPNIPQSASESAIYHRSPYRQHPPHLQSSPPGGGKQIQQNFTPSQYHQVYQDRRLSVPAASHPGQNESRTRKNTWSPGTQRANYQGQDKYPPISENSTPQQVPPTARGPSPSSPYSGYSPNLSQQSLALGLDQLQRPNPVARQHTVPPNPRPLSPSPTSGCGSQRSSPYSQLSASDSALSGHSPGSPYGHYSPHQGPSPPGGGQNVLQFTTQPGAVTSRVSPPKVGFGSPNFPEPHPHPQPRWYEIGYSPVHLDQSAQYQSSYGVPQSPPSQGVANYPSPVKQYPATYQGVSPSQNSATPQQPAALTRHSESAFRPHDIPISEVPTVSTSLHTTEHPDPSHDKIYQNYPGEAPHPSAITTQADFPSVNSAPTVTKPRSDTDSMFRFDEEQVPSDSESKSSQPWREPEFQARGRNELEDTLPDDVSTMAGLVIEEVSGRSSDKKTDIHMPLDSNLCCQFCKKVFRQGEIQKYRKHSGTCRGRNGNQGVKQASRSDQKPTPKPRPRKGQAF